VLNVLGRASHDLVSRDWLTGWSEFNEDVGELRWPGNYIGWWAVTSCQNRQSNDFQQYWRAVVFLFKGPFFLDYIKLG